MFTKIKNFVKSIPTIIKSFLSRCWVRLINLAYGPEIILDEDMAIIDALFSTPFSNTMRGAVLAHSISVLIPTSTKTIRFKDTWDLTGEELAQGFRAIPPSITTLDLSGNGLGYKKAALEIAFRAIPPSITTLDLSYNIYLADKTVEELQMTFRAIPPSVTTLELSFTHLYKKTGSELAQAFAAIPTSVTILNLSKNRLRCKTGSELAQAFAAIPTSVTTLNLSDNNLYKKTGSELAQDFTAIPPSVETLDLSDNHLNRKIGSELAQAFAAIPTSVTTLNLSDNYLSCKTGAELEQIIQAIPDTVTKIIIGTEITISSSQTKEAIIASVARHNNMNMITEDQLKMGCQITRGLYFYGEGLLARPAGFDKKKKEQAALCLMKARAEDKKTGKLKAINLPYDMALKSIGQYLTPVDMAKLTMTCKPLKPQ